jgi:hypothetical protein
MKRPFVAGARMRQRRIGHCSSGGACYSFFMTEDSSQTALARIEKALTRIEAASRRVPAPSNDSEARYQALRSRTQAALASLETVIAKVGGGR